MDKAEVSGKQLRNIMIMFLLGSSIIIKGAVYAPHCSWISELIAMVLAIPMLLMYSRLASINRDKNLYDLFYDSFGRVGGTIATILFLMYSVWLSTAILRNFTEFIVIAFFPETPQYFPAIFAGLVMLYTIRNGIEVIGRGISFVISFIVAIIITTALLSVPHMDFTHILPLFVESPKNIMNEAYQHLTFPYLETVMFLMVTPHLSKKESVYKSYMFSLFLTTPLFLLIYFRNLFVLGAHALKVFFFPAYSATSLINIAKFITRVEVVAAANYTMCVLLKSIICLYSACKGFCKLFKVNDYKVFTTPVLLFVVFFSDIIYENTFDMFDSIVNYTWYRAFFEILIPVLTFIVIEIKYRVNRNKVQVQSA